MSQDEQASQIGGLVLEQDQKRKLCFTLQVKLLETGAAIKRFGVAASQSTETASLEEIPIIDVEDIIRPVLELKGVQDRLVPISSHLKKLGL
jgi:hypothetical protein